MAVSSYVTNNQYRPIRSATGSTTNPDAAFQNTLASTATFNAIQRQASLGSLSTAANGTTNPDFALTSVGNKNVQHGGGDLRMVRGYIRRADGEVTTDPTSKYRMNFMFNPEQIQRSYIAYLDQQALDPFNTLHSGNLTAPPGILDFQFDLLFDRQIEVARDTKHPGTKVDYDFFDLVIRGVIPQAGHSAAIADNGIMLVNPRNITVVFNSDLQVMGKAYNAGIRFEKFSHNMTCMRMTISLQMKVFSIGSRPLTYTYGTENAIKTYSATVPYDTQIKVTDPKTAAYVLPDSGVYDTLFGVDSSAQVGSDSSSSGTTGDIFAVGDSLLVGSGSALKGDLPGRNIEIDAKVGRPTTEGLTVLRAKGTRGLPMNVLINLGTNDAQDGSFAAKVEAILSYLGPNRKVFWDTVWFGPAGSNHPDAVNTILNNAKGAHPNLTVIDVRPAASGNPGHLDGSGYAAKALIEAGFLKTTSAPVGTAPGDPQGNQKIVRDQAAADYGWTGAEWDALYQLLMHESGFKSSSQNPSSSAHGIFQFLTNTWAGVGGSYTDDPVLQTKYGLKYIKQRYGTPSNAWAQWQARSPHWY